jgi:hypothetical protein
MPCGSDAKEWKETRNAVASSEAKKDCVPPAPLLSTNDSVDLNDDQSTIYNVDIDDRNTTADTSGNGADQLLGTTPSPGSAGSGPPKQKEGDVARARKFDPQEQLQQALDRLAAADDKKDCVPPGTNDLFDLNDDQSTIYNVDIDDSSIVARDTADASGYGADQLLGSAASPGSTGSGPPTLVKKPYLLKVVLLLMDPNTRRFELLQLEFDSLKALVSDALNQIPVSVTEESLRSQQYSGICGKSATLIASDQLLSTFCVGNDVLVAVPTLLTAKQCTRLAKPILSDDKVLSMVGLAWLSEAMFILISIAFWVSPTHLARLCILSSV